MDVGEFGDRVAEGVVDLSDGAVSAVDVGERDVGDMRRGGGGEGLNTVAGDEGDVSLQIREGLSDIGNGAAGVDGGGCGGGDGGWGPVNDAGWGKPSAVRVERVSPWVGLRCIPVANI